MHEFFFYLFFAFLSCTSEHKKIAFEDYKDFSIAPDMVDFIKRKEGVDILKDVSAGPPDRENHLILYLESDKTYINNSFGKSLLDSVLIETWRRDRYLILVCDSKATPAEREKYFEIYRAFISAGRVVLKEKALKTFNRQFNSLSPYERHSLGSGVPFILFTKHIRGSEYKTWTDRFFLFDEQNKRQIPAIFIPDVDNI